MNNIILGAGLSGLTLGDLFKQRKIPFSIFEKENQTGGLCVTANVNNFLFDKTGHLLYFRDKQSKDYIMKRLKIKLKKQEKNSIIIYKKNIIPYPFQLNLWALPKRDREHCITSIMKLGKQIIKHGDISRDAENFRDWAINNFGKGIAQKFLLPYNRKLWRIPLKELSLGWLGDFVPKPDYSDILNSAIEKPENKVGYNPYFYYPEKGGIQVLVNKLTTLVKSKTFLNSKATEINLKEKVIKINNKKHRFKNIYSSIPLIELVKLIKDIPIKIVELNSKLKYLSVLYMNLGLEGKTPHKYHWIYFPENKYPFYRIGFFNNISKSLAPINSTSIYVEFSYIKDIPFTFQNILRKTLHTLKTNNLVTPDANIKAVDINEIKYAYVIYTKESENAKKNIIDFLKENNIHTLGRYGNWEYSSMEKSLRDAFEIIKDKELS